MPSVYVSITGLRLRSALHLPRFWWHAVRAMAQAKAAPGLLSAEARRIDGVHHTLTVWESRAAMRAYLGAGAHRAAIRAFTAIATGKVLGYEADRAPPWSDVPAVWAARGRVL